MLQPENTIPEHKEGTEVNVEESLRLPDNEEARSFFSSIKKRLLNVNGWNKVAGSLSADFQLTNEHGDPIDTLPQKGNFFKINIPAPGIITGEGYDWVQVEEIKEESDEDVEYLAMRVRPASSPLNNREDTAHFYTEEATSNFIIRREGSLVTAGVYGRNEKPNIKAETLIDKARNAIVGSTAIGGFAKLQWKALVNGLLEQK